MSAVALLQFLRNPDRAFSQFFAQRGKYSAFKSKHGQPPIRFVSIAFGVKDGQRYIAKSEEALRLVLSCPLPDQVTSITVSKATVGHFVVASRGEQTIKPYRSPISWLA